MLRRRSGQSGLKDTKFYGFGAAVLTGFFVILGCLFLFSAVISKIDAPSAVVAVMSTAALCAGAYSGGFVGAKKRRKNGMMVGIVTGTAIFFVIFLLSLIFAKTAVSISAGTKLILAVIFGAVGGVIGVNSKNKRY